MKHKVINSLLAPLSLNERKRYADQLGDEFWEVANDDLILLDERDYTLYQLVRIGSQVWMAENLRYNHPNSYDPNPNAPVEYGRYYDWETALASAPKGFHLPFGAEWNEMEIALGMAEADAGKTSYRGTHGTGMKSTTGWSNDGNGDNGSRFNAFPAGYYHYGSYYGFGIFAYFWSASEYDASSAWYLDLYSVNAGVSRNNGDESSGLSCRYLMDL